MLFRRAAQPRCRRSARESGGANAVVRDEGFGMRETGGQAGRGDGFGAGEAGGGLLVEGEELVEIPRVPRSMSRDTPPVWRSRWKRRLRLCRCRNTCRATRRMARFATRTNTMYYRS